jgi:hypothetical protein
MTHLVDHRHLCHRLWTIIRSTHLDSSSRSDAQCVSGQGSRVGGSRELAGQLHHWRRSSADDCVDWVRNLCIFRDLVLPGGDFLVSSGSGDGQQDAGDAGSGNIDT